MKSAAITNIGMLFTGDIQNPLMPGPLSIRIEDGKIKAVEKDGKGSGEGGVNAQGMTVCPGLIDSHTHPVFGDFTPRQNQLGFIESSLHGGVTAMISAGRSTCPAGPRTARGRRPSPSWRTNLFPAHGLRA